MSSTKLESNSANLHIALVYLLSTLLADEIFNSLYYYIKDEFVYIYTYLDARHFPVCNLYFSIFTINFN